METKLKEEEEIDSEGKSDANEETERAEKQSCTHANALVFPGASHWVGTWPKWNQQEQTEKQEPQRHQKPENDNHSLALTAPVFVGLFIFKIKDRTGGY